MGYVDENLLPDEHVVYHAHLHWIIYGFPAFFAVLGLVLISIGLTHEDMPVASGIGLLIVFLSGVAAVGKYVNARNAEFAVTNRRVLIKVGILSRHTLELLLQKVESIGVDQDLGGRIFDFGTIVVIGTGGTKERFGFLADPLEFRRQVQAESSTAHTPSAYTPPQITTGPAAGPFCVSCGTRNPEGANFCSKCGTRVAAAPSA